ncbi:MAG: hypothetical protein BGP03_23350 [Pseudonocardia sp. 73-21]|nr:MAG: hypothetical protein BGP03_23350 [Pseudonocardia sp. 73-21]
MLLMLGPDLRRDAMRRARVAEDEIRQLLRLGGIGDRADVGCVVLERTGQISVVRAGIDESLLVDVLRTPR